MQQPISFFKRHVTNVLFAAAFLSAMTFQSCEDDPKPVNEEEVITTLKVTLAPAGGGNNVTLQFTDLDGDGSGQPVTSVSGPLQAGKSYTGVITILNESGTSVVDITPEVEEESADHIFCFTVNSVNLSVTAADADDNGLPIGLRSTWVTTTSGNVNVKIVLRHQPGTKTGTCPGGGETDAEVDFDLTIQ